jgi:cytoskeleton protein RodZ
MNPVFGKQLTRAREIRGISIEEAAHATRMRPAMVEALETGNLEAFPNPAYAKSFLLLYGKYLRLDVKAVAAEIDTGMQVTVEDYQYLTHAKETTPGPARRGDFARPHSLPSWTPVIALGGITAVVVFGFLLWLNMSRIGDGGNKPMPKAGTQAEGIEPVVAGAQPVKVSGPTTAPRPSVPPQVPAVAEAVAAPVSEPVPPVEPPVAEEPVVVAAVPPPPSSGNQAPAPVYPKDPPPPIVKTPPPFKVPAAAPVAVAVPAVAPKSPIIGATTSLTPPPVAEPVTTIDGVEVRTARVISPAAKIATNDAAMLANVENAESAPQTAPPLTGLTPVEEPEASEVPQDSSPLAKDPNTVEIEPVKKTWVVVRREAGGPPVYEDFLYPSARPMRLPAGKYFIEARDADAIEIRRAGKTIPYLTGGVRIE